MLVKDVKHERRGKPTGEIGREDKRKVREKDSENVQKHVWLINGVVWSLKSSISRHFVFNL